MISKVYAPALYSFDGRLVEIECDISHGLPGMLIVGLGDKAVEEARERVRSAIRNSGLVLPPKRLTLNLAPADLPKDGTGYDLGLAIAILTASGQLDADTTRRCLFMGELALDGEVRPVRGALMAAQLAGNARFDTVYVAHANAAEAALIKGVNVKPVINLAQLYRHLSAGEPLEAIPSAKGSRRPAPYQVDMQDIQGLGMAKRVVEIAAAGGHNLLLTGPPGAGKTLLARALAGLMPPPEPSEIIEMTNIYSLAGLSEDGPILERPFRTPHHSASSVALVGGGSPPRPGEISLAHMGVLFMDELPEFQRVTLEALRQPLEDGRVTVARASGVVTFPARFMLVATQNPCPCGYAGDMRRVCTCTGVQVSRYRNRLSGPLVDRIDLLVDVDRVDLDRLVTPKPGEPSSVIAARVKAARRIQAERYKQEPYRENAGLDTAGLKSHCGLGDDAAIIAQAALQRLGLSARGYSRALKVARTIADLDGSPDIKPNHLSEAFQYRSRRDQAETLQSDELVDPLAERRKVNYAP